MQFPRLLTAAFAALCCTIPLFAQKAYGGPDPDRKASTMFVFGDDFHAYAGASISYSQPQWNDKYNDMLPTLKGKNARLGKNWWTSLDTIGAMEIAGTKIEAGSYFLGLHVDQDGNFHLLLLDAKKAMQGGVLPFHTDNLKADAKAPLTLAKDSLPATVEKMEIEISADKNDPSTGRFAIRWGKHELSAKVKLTLTPPKK